MTGETPLDYKLDSMHEKAMMGHFDTHDIYWLIAAYRQLIREHDEVVLKQARVEFENADLRRQLDAVPVDAMLECIGPDGYDFTAPTLTVQRFANWLEAERAARR